MIRFVPIATNLGLYEIFSTESIESEDSVNTRQEALNLLRNQLNDSFAEFRDGQWEAIDALVTSRQRILVVQRTGWGKSSVYFIATRIFRERGFGPSLIISPLLSLMRNQIDSAQRLGVRLKTINSTNSNEWTEVEKLVNGNEIDALIISPERLANDEFVENTLLKIADNVGLLVIDEAHCISDWGHDFRPDYRRLVNVLQYLPENMPLIATTATANNRVVADIETQLEQVKIQRGSLMRSTLELQNIVLPSQAERLAWLANHLNELPGTGIVYTLTTRDSEVVADWLTMNGIDAKAYHASIKNDEFNDTNSYREHLEQSLLDNKIKALVATVALGMGFDKPDLGFVVHYQAPSSVVAYYQQVGRAGRAIDRAVGIMMSGSEDDDIHEYFRRTAFPHERWVKGLLNLLESKDGFTQSEIEGKLNLRTGQISTLLKYLSSCNPSPVYKEGNCWYRTPVHFTLDDELIERLTRQRETEWEEIKNYLNYNGCLMEFLARALDDNNPVECGKCQACRGAEIIPTDISPDSINRANQFLRRTDSPLVCRKRLPQGYFNELRKNLSIEREYQAEVGRILSRWGDAGWGKMVETCKNSGYLNDELLFAVVAMLDRWQPNPKPEWVTCVPSDRNAKLVPDFAERLASNLGLPFLPVIEKVRANEPQKFQQNNTHQCKNLSGVFAITQEPPKSPVLLVDDIVDSRWTLTICAGLLRHSGSGPVFPVALASIAGG